jgi:hypothetical protein
MAEMRSAVPSHKNRHRRRIRHQVAVERHDLEQVARQRQAAGRPLAQ